MYDCPNCGKEIDCSPWDYIICPHCNTELFWDYFGTHMDEPFLIT